MSLHGCVNQMEKNSIQFGKQDGWNFKPKGFGEGRVKGSLPVRKPTYFNSHKAKHLGELMISISILKQQMDVREIFDMGGYEIFLEYEYIS